MLVPLAFGAAAVGLLFVALPGHSRAQGRGVLPPHVVDLARKWAQRRGLPVKWVLATILVESQGAHDVVGDEGGRSVGYMQVNTVAHADRLARAGVSRNDLFNPNTNIEWGTLILREAYNQVVQALDGRTPPIPMSILVRLAYKGPTAVVSALRQGRNPLVAYPATFPSYVVTRWDDALAKSSALV